MKYWFLTSWKKMLFSIIYILIILLAYILINGDFSLLISYIDGLFIGGFSLTCFGALVLLSNLGTFDMFSYMFSKKTPERKTLYDYSESKVEIRKKNRLGFLPIVIVGVFAILVAIILLLIK